MKLFNTRTNTIEDIIIDDEFIGVYTCGPTVYDRVHIGNLKTMFWSDFFVSFLEFLYPNKVKGIINITDIDDKIISRLDNQTKEELSKYTQSYTNLFLNDLKSLIITRYHNNYHTVTDNLESIYEMITKLKNENYAYQLNNGSIYFDSSKVDNYPFPNYKKENYLEFDNERNIIRDDGVKDYKDFILWKCKENEQIKWETSSIISGRPGWHIECSAIANKHLQQVTFHIGGEDLKFPHHTCEILQSESYNPNKIFGRYWLHIGFLNFNGDKMSKSIGNILTLDNLNINKYLLRYYLFHKNYRKQNDFSIDEINTYKIPFLNLHKLYNKVYSGLTIYNLNDAEHNELLIFDEVINNISNDLDTKTCLNFVNKYVITLLKKHISFNDSKIIIQELDKINQLFKILDPDILHIPDDIKDIINQRIISKNNKNYSYADKLRNDIVNKGFLIEDYKDHYIIIKNI